MNYAWIALCGLGALSAVTTTSGIANAEPPAWMKTQINSIERPVGLSGAEQEACTQSLLDEMNHRLRTAFTRSDVTPIQMPDWDSPEIGFIRGGAFNIRVVSSLPKKYAKHTHIKPGRFANFESWLKMGAQASLHIPDKLDGQALFMKTESSDGERIDYDFVAHSDSAYAYLPAGIFVHLFRDVIGADSRNPCPIEPHDNDNDSTHDSQE